MLVEMNSDKSANQALTPPSSYYSMLVVDIQSFYMQKVLGNNVPANVFNYVSGSAVQNVPSER